MLNSHLPHYYGVYILLFWPHDYHCLIENAVIAQCKLSVSNSDILLLTCTVIANSKIKSKVAWVILDNGFELSFSAITYTILISNF